MKVTADSAIVRGSVISDSTMLVPICVVEEVLAVVPSRIRLSGMLITETTMFTMTLAAMDHSR